MLTDFTFVSKVFYIVQENITVAQWLSPSDSHRGICCTVQ